VHYRADRQQGFHSLVEPVSSNQQMGATPGGGILILAARLFLLNICCSQARSIGLPEATDTGWRFMNHRFGVIMVDTANCAAADQSPPLVYAGVNNRYFLAFITAVRRAAERPEVYPPSHILAALLIMKPLSLSLLSPLPLLLSMAVMLSMWNWRAGSNPLWCCVA